MRQVVKRIIDEAVDRIVDEVLAKIAEPINAKLEAMVEDMVLDLADDAVHAPADGSAGSGGVHGGHGGHGDMQLASTAAPERWWRRSEGHSDRPRRVRGRRWEGIAAVAANCMRPLPRPARPGQERIRPQQRP